MQPSSTGSPLSPRSVLAELSTSSQLNGLSPASSSSSSSCTPASPTSGTIAIGVGFPSHVDANNKENVEPIFDSNVHRPSLPSSADDDEDEDDDEDIFAAIERMRREREADCNPDPPEEFKQGRDDEQQLDAFHDPFEQPPHHRPIDIEERFRTQHATSKPSQAPSISSPPPPPSTLSSLATDPISRQPASNAASPPASSSLRSTQTAAPRAVLEDADADVGGSTEAIRPAATKKKAKNIAAPSSVKAISSFFSVQPSTAQSTASSSSTAMASTPTQVSQVSKPYGPSVPRPSFFGESRKRRREEAEAMHEPLRPPQGSTDTPLVSHAQVPAAEAAVKEVQQAVEPAAVEEAVKANERVEVFTADEDDEEAVDDIEAQLMGDDEPEEAVDPQPEPEITGSHEQHQQAAAAQEGDGEEDEDDDGEGENEEEELAAALLDEASDEDSEERRRAVRLAPSALEAELSPSRRSTSDSESESEESEEDWEAMQAEDDQERKARLEALHSNTERLVRSAVSSEQAVKAITAGGKPVLEESREEVNPVYERLLARLREKEKQMGEQVGTRYIHETAEEQRRRMKREERERAEAKRTAIVEKNVHGERVMEIDLDELDQEEDEDEDEEEEEEEDVSQAEEEEDTPAVTPAAASKAADAAPSASDVEVRPFSPIVAEEAAHAAPIDPQPSASSPSSTSAPTPRLSDASTEEESDSPTSSASDPVPSPPSSTPVVQDADDAVDDEDMDEETRELARLARKRIRKRKAREAEQERMSKVARFEEPIISEDAMMELPQPPPPATFGSSGDADATVPHVSAVPAPPPSATANLEMDRRKSRQRRCILVDGEAEDEDLVDGRRHADAEDDDERAVLDEYEEDGFVTREAVDDATAAEQLRAAHASLDAARDKEAVDALQAKFVTRTSSTSKNDRLEQIRRAHTNGLQRRGSHGSRGSSPSPTRSPAPSPVKAASPVPPASGAPVRSGSEVLGSALLDDDLRASDGEEDDCDENSAAREHRRKLLQHRAKMLKQNMTAAARAPSPSPSPPTSLSRFDMDESSLSSPSPLLPPLASPLHPPTRTLSRALMAPPLSDLTSLHAQLSRQRSVVRQNSFLGEVGRVAGVGGGSGTVQVQVQVKSVSLNKSYIFRRVTDDHNENHHRAMVKGESPQGAGAEKGKGKEKGGKAEAKREVEKRPVQGAAFLSALARSKSTLTTAHAASMKRKNSSGGLLSAISAARPSMLRAASDK